MIVQNLLKGGVKIGISSRGLGAIKEGDGCSIVSKLKLVTLGDIVSDPSAPDAFLQGVYEGAEWVYENGVYKKIDLSQEIDEYQQLLANTKKKDIQEAAVKIMTDYFSKLK
jgi:hypothetical protein